ncbi:MAG: hypothetical protein LLF92_00660 [Planctomycetaceae bacterium]|nr:hypothetical protein [Planctomycetaceae bacterium]
MKILKYIPILIFMLILAGCNEQKKVDHWQNVSINDLMPKGGPARTKDTIIGLSVFVFEADSGRYLAVQSAMAGTSELQVDASGNINLAENGMICGNGDLQNWPGIAKSLADANAVIVKRVTLFMTENVSEQIELAGFPQGASVCYQTDNKTTAAVGLPEGSVLLDINAKSLIGLKQVCQLEIKPIYKTIRKKVEEKRIPAWEYLFDSIGCKSPVRPGQFIFLSPQIDDIKTSEQKAIANVGRLIFTDKQKENRVKFCLIVCGLIKD